LNSLNQLTEKQWEKLLLPIGIENALRGRLQQSNEIVQPQDQNISIYKEMNNLEFGVPLPGIGPVIYRDVVVLDNDAKYEGEWKFGTIIRQGKGK